MSAPRRNKILLTAVGALLPTAFAVSLLVGAYPLELSDVLAALAGEKSMAAQVFWRLRLPRTLAAAAGGAALGLSGAAYQLLFANPLAAPDIMGVSGGATLGAALAIVGGFSALAAPAAFLGGAAALLMSLLLARVSRGVYALVVSGVLVSALAKTGVMLLKLLADTDGELAAIEFFTMGSFASVTASDLPALLVGVGVGCLGVLLLRRQILLLAASDEEARALGVSPERMRAVILVFATLMAAAVSACAGVIAFLPLIAPHAARLLLRGRTKGLLPLSMLTGGVLLLTADILARLTAGAELPISVLTTLLGVPCVAVLMAKGGARRG